MAIATVEDVARALEIDMPTGRVAEALALALAAAIESVEDYTAPRTWTVLTEATVATTRTYAGESPVITIADVAIDEVTVEESCDLVTWTEVPTTAWHLEPFNRAAAFELWRHRCHFTPWVRVTGRHGVTAVPAAVKDATVLWAAKLYERFKSPGGVTYGGEFGPIRITRAEDPDIARLLDTVAPAVIA